MRGSVFIIRNFHVESRTIFQLDAIKIWQIPQMSCLRYPVRPAQPLAIDQATLTSLRGQIIIDATTKQTRGRSYTIGILLKLTSLYQHLRQPLKSSTLSSTLASPCRRIKTINPLPVHHRRINSSPAVPTPTFSLKAKNERNKWKLCSPMKRLYHKARTRSIKRLSNASSRASTPALSLPSMATQRT
jgi:hypothetical protein